jgi:hypothetical protein
MALSPAPGETLGSRPGDQNRCLTVDHLETEVVMEGSGVMLLDHEQLADRCGQRVDIGDGFRGTHDRYGPDDPISW